jgi:hypothetical protein
MEHTLQPHLILHPCTGYLKQLSITCTYLLPLALHSPHIWSNMVLSVKTNHWLLKEIMQIVWNWIKNSKQYITANHTITYVCHRWLRPYIGHSGNMHGHTGKSGSV